MAIATLCFGLAACGEVPTDLGPGEACLRTEQCGPGLACSAGMCTTDLTLLGMNAMVPDAGPAMDGAVGVDAAVPDGGMVGVDAGPRRDAGPAGMDAGPPGMDAGPPGMDAGPPGMDAGAPDAGP
jgi:hypothetical protein